jgi:esterase/lipase
MAAIDTMNKMLDTSNDTISNFSNMLDFASEKLEKINNAGEAAMVFKDQVVEASNSIISTFSDIYNGDFEIPESIMGSGFRRGEVCDK